LRSFMACPAFRVLQQYTIKERREKEKLAEKRGGVPGLTNPGIVLKWQKNRFFLYLQGFGDIRGPRDKIENDRSE